MCEVQVSLIISARKSVVPNSHRLEKENLLVSKRFSSRRQPLLACALPCTAVCGPAMTDVGSQRPVRIISYITEYWSALNWGLPLYYDRNKVVMKCEQLCVVRARVSGGKTDNCKQLVPLFSVQTTTLKISHMQWITELCTSGAEELKKINSSQSWWLPMSVNYQKKRTTITTRQQAHHTLVMEVCCKS